MKLCAQEKENHEAGCLCISSVWVLCSKRQVGTEPLLHSAPLKANMELKARDAKHLHGWAAHLGQMFSRVTDWGGGVSRPQV